MLAKRFTAAAIAAASLIGCQGASPADSLAQSLPKTSSTSPQAVSASRRTAITEAVARVAPAVVTVQTEVVERVPVDPFDMIFGRQSGDRIGAGLGSGFITDPNGIIVTNAHVVADAANGRITVTFSDGRTGTARVVGSNTSKDIAVQG